ncbi:MAG: NUDIX hydrolase [Gammaproteobacteria bacterium]|nr:NUDIX hydrolase [Gammaproteobacteria bacterium]
MDDWYAHVTVATLVEQDGRFLLVEERSNGDLVINQPAGHLDPDEDLVQAAVRETLEETGWHVKIEGVLGIALYTAPNGITYHRTTFHARALEWEPDLALDAGIERALWLSYEEMQAYSDKMRSPLVLATVEQYRNGHHYPLDLIYS